MSSSAYRNPDDLAAAQRRVTELEAEIAAIVPPRKPRSLIIMAVISSSLAVATVVASIILVFWIRGKDKAARDKANAEAAAAAAAGTPTTAASTPPPPKPTTRIYTQPYFPLGRPPIYRDLNDDGVADIIMLLWAESSPPEQRLRVAAINGKNMDVMWEAGAWPATWATGPVTITEAGSYILVSDGDGRLHSLDRATGKKQHEWSLPNKPGPAFRVCAAADGRPHVVVFPTPGTPHEYDLTDRRERVDTNSKEWSSWCAHHYGDKPACTDLNTNEVCVSSSSPAPIRNMKPTVAYDDRELTITFGTALRPVNTPYFVTKSRTDNNKISYEGPAIGDEEVARMTSAPPTHAMQLDGRKVFTLYENTSHELRLSGRDASLGKLLFAVTLEERVLIDLTHALDVVDHNLLVVRLTSSLRTFDMNGNEKRRIEKVTLDVESDPFQLPR